MIAGHQPGTRLRPAAEVRPRGHPTPLGQAFAEYGSIAKTLHPLAVVAQIRDEDVARLSPLEHKNLNVLGRYNFTASQPVSGLRPLRDPDAPDLDDDDDGTDE
ncbi:hypothetical protein OIU91_03205 [Streptomyces sp. NBC_01456]|nr:MULTISPECIES: hypothetical protein [unclassified Streptomyces]